MSSTHRSYEIVPVLDLIQQGQMDRFAEKWNLEQRRFYKEKQINPNLDLNAYKRNFIVKTGLTGRHFNSLRDDLKGKEDSVLELMKEQLSVLKDTVAKLAKTLKSLSHKSNRLNSKEAARKFKTEQKLKIKEARVLYLETSLKQKNPHLCFGSKRLFQAQFNHQALNKNNPNQFKDFMDWKKTWQSSRSATFCMIGSKDESCGNVNCQLKLDTPDADTGILQINTGTEKLKISIQLKYGREFIQAGLLNEQALTYRFNKDSTTNNWRVRVSLDVQKTAPAIKTFKDIGVVSVDINSDHLAVTELDRMGNVIYAFTIDLNLYGKSTEQAKALTGDAIKKLTEYAESKAKPLVIEDLNFEKKRQNLKINDTVRYKRMLSSFSYSRIIQLIRARTQDRGIELILINPAYTSQIGALKYQERFNLSKHHAAAMVIGRRGMGFKEKLFKFVQAQTTSAVPVRNQYKSLFAYWKAVFSKLRAHVVRSSKTVELKVDDFTFGQASLFDLSKRDYGDFCLKSTNLVSVAVSLT